MAVTQPDYLADDQWLALTLAVLHGVFEGVRGAEIKAAWASDLGVAA
ncbi:hypothetical protein [Streptomyces sp. JW3]